MLLTGHVRSTKRQRNAKQSRWQQRRSQTECKGRDVQVLYLSAGFGDFGRRVERVLGVGMVAGSKGFYGVEWVTGVQVFWGVVGFKYRGDLIKASK